MTEHIEFKVGDKFTIVGVYKTNPAWRWWKFWQPKHTNQLAEHTVVYAVGQHLGE